MNYLLFDLNFTRIRPEVLSELKIEIKEALQNDEIIMIANTLKEKQAF